MTADDRAQQLLAERRVWLTNETEDASVAVVGGRHALYTVTATRAGVACNCQAARRCSHVLAAMAAWHDREVAAALMRETVAA